MTKDRLSEIDRSGMFRHLLGFPEQWAEGRQRALEVRLDPRAYQKEQPVLVVGMGGSAIGGDLLRTLALDEARAPILVGRGYHVPAWVQEGTSVVASSYSGNTEETLSATREAWSRGANVVCVTSGGELNDWALEHGLPVFPLPGGMPPRAALGASFTALLTLAERVGWVKPGEEAWAETADYLDAGSRRLSNLDGNEAMELAASLQGLFPFIYSGNGLLEAVNLRWRTQIQENSKLPAAGNVFPELNHNEIVGWEAAEPSPKQVGVVVLRDKGDDPRVQQRIQVTRSLLEARAGFWSEVQTQGKSPLCRLLSLVQLGDWVSYYLAVQNGVDPTPIGLIHALKTALSGS